MITQELLAVAFRLGADRLDRGLYTLVRPVTNQADQVFVGDPVHSSGVILKGVEGQRTIDVWRRAAANLTPAYDGRYLPDEIVG